MCLCNLIAKDCNIFFFVTCERLCKRDDKDLPQDPVFFLSPYTKAEQHLLSHTTAIPLHAQIVT